MANNIRHDVALDANEDLAVRNGDLFAVESDQQHIKDTINAWPGWWKEFPLDGVAVSKYRKSSSGLQLLARKVRLELSTDGYQVDNPMITLTTDGRLQIQPNTTR